MSNSRMHWKHPVARRIQLPMLRQRKLLLLIFYLLSLDLQSTITTKRKENH